jgi:hypothetical protein
MINHEDIYKWLQASNWTKLIDVLHRNRDEIKSDTILQYAASIFENEFLRQAGEHPVTVEIGDQLENLYILHRGNFYKLKEENYLKLLAQLGRHNAGNQGEGYLRELKSLTSIKSAPTKVEPLKPERPPRKFYDIATWTEIYNRVFELISVQADSSTYFPGPRFIRVVQEFKPFFPDYQQYRKIREQAGQSISRKDYFHDILKELDPNIRDIVIAKILTMVRPFEPTAVSEIDRLMGVQENLNDTEYDLPRNPLIFISYTWDDEPHKEWVLKLANRFISEGIDAIIDRHELRPGRNMPHFMERAIAKADKVLIIFTPGYKEKADNRTGGAGYEYSIMNADLYHNQTTNEKIIPILRAGTQQESIPAFMRQFIYLDMSDNRAFSDRYNELKKYIRNEPIIEKPAVGASSSI